MARNTLLNLLGQGAPLLVGIVTTPLVLRELGPERYGILSMTLVVLGYFGLFDLGLGRAATRFVATALGSGSEDSVPAIAWTAVIVQTGLGLLAAAVLLLITPVLVTRVLNIPPELMDEARASFYVLAFSIPAVLVSGSLRGVLEAAQRFDLVNAAAAPLSAANFFLPYVGVLLRWKLPAIVAILLGSRTIGLAVFYLLCVHVFPALKRTPRFHVAAARQLLGFGSWVTVSSIVGPILVYLDRVMIGVLLTMTAVAFYAAPYEMVTRLLIVPISLVGTLFPAFSGIHQDSEIRVLHRLVSSSVKYLLLALAPAVVVLLAFSGDVLGLWLGPEFATHSAPALQILSIGVLANSIAQVPFALIQGSGRPDLTAKIHLMEIPIQFGVAWGCVRMWGITGAALAWAARTTLDALLLFVVASRLTVTSWRSLAEMQVPQLVGLVGLFGSAAFASSVLIHDAQLRIVVLAPALAFGSRLVWRQMLSDEERGQIRRLLRTIGNRV